MLHIALAVRLAANPSVPLNREPAPRHRVAIVNATSKALQDPPPTPIDNHLSAIHAYRRGC